MYSGVDQRKHQSSASLAFMRGIHQWPVNSPHRWPVTRKRFPFDDVIMIFHNAIHQWVQISNFLIYFRVITQHWVDDLVSSEIILKDIDKSSATKKQSIQTVCIHLFHDLTLNNVRWLILLISRRLMMTWLNGNIFALLALSVGNPTGHRWIPLTKASDAELWWFFFICAWTNGWVDHQNADDLRRHCARYDVRVMPFTTAQ